MRQFIRHPTSIPIEFSCRDAPNPQSERLKDVNQGGLCFGAGAEIKTGAAIHIRIPVCEPPFEAQGEVVWCRKANAHYDVGVKFEDSETEFAVRMVEQICHIEQFRHEVLEKDGRTLSSEEAAYEWIRQHAKDFPE